MKNMIVNSIAIISPNSKTAKYAEFTSGINVVTSNKNINGNYVGKSSLLRSIYHTLGADGKFSTSLWEREGKYTYILDFSIDNIRYRMLRFDNLFKLYAENNELLFKVINRIDLAIELNKLFNQEIYLKNKNNEYSVAHPAFNYLLNYIDQKEIRVSEFSTFNSLNAFSAFYSDLLYSHLGVNSKQFNELKIESDELNRKISEVNKKNQMFNEMLAQIDKNKDLNSNYSEIEVLKKELQKHQDEYTKLIGEANKLKEKLLKTNDSKIEIELAINELRNMINSDEKVLNKSLKEHTCPICNSELRDDSHAYIHKAVDVDGAKFQLLDAERELGKLSREITLTNSKYEENLAELKKIEARVFEGNKGLENTIKSYGMKKIKANLFDELSVNEASKITFIEKRKRITKLLKSLDDRKKEVNMAYLTNFYDIYQKYSLGGFDLSSVDSVETKIKVDGTRVNITQVAWLCSLLKTKYEFNPNSLIYPLVFDNPNNADFDEDNERKIFNLIFDNLPENGQIITSLVGFDQNMYTSYEIKKIIVLVNPENSLLNNNDFELCLDIYSSIL